MSKGTRRQANRIARSPARLERVPEAQDWYFPALAFFDAEARLAELERAVAGGRSVRPRFACPFAVPRTDVLSPNT